MRARGSHRDRAIKTLAAACAVAWLAGCASLGESERAQPTHRWVSSEDVAKARFNFDNKQCSDESNVNLDGTLADDPQFIAYQRCMVTKGYELATY